MFGFFARASLVLHLPLPLVLGALAGAGCSDSEGGGGAVPATGGAAGMGGQGGAAPEPGGILRRSGRQLVDAGGYEVWLRGVAFGNEVWSDNPLPDTHHNELDYQRVADMNMNAIRFYLNYRTFEDDSAPYVYKDEGWAWLDQNVEWARAHGIYLIPNMHAPQGGYQSQGEGTALWTEPENQNRLAALWRAIAERYRDEPVIAGYDLVNEPVVTQSRQQWEDLAAQVVSAIREVDDQHLVMVERLNAIGDNWGLTPDESFFLVDDENVLYEFHFYSPHEYTHQLLDWAGMGDGGSYPDESRVQVDWQYMTWMDWTYNAPALAVDETDWAEKRFRCTVTDPDHQIALPILMSANNTGTVYFDDIVINEYDENDNFVREVLNVDIEDDSEWYLWEDGAGTGVKGVGSDGHRGSASITLSGTTTDASLSADAHTFAATLGHSYEVIGWMKGENSQPGAQSLIRLDLYRYDSELVVRNRAFLEQSLQAYLAWGEANGVPLYLGEFGTNYHTFQNDKGGLQWVQDVLDIMLENHVHFTYHAYHEDAFGIYYGYGSLPDPTDANQPLIDLFTEKLQ